MTPFLNSDNIFDVICSSMQESGYPIFITVAVEKMEEKIAVVEDQPELLELMLADGQEAHLMYQPTNYWSFYQGAIIDSLKSEGLAAFRSSACVYLNAFGASDLHPIKELVSIIKGISATDEEARTYIAYLALIANNSNIPLLPYGLSLDDLNETAYRMAETHGILSRAHPLAELSASLAGKPEYYFTVNGKNYTNTFLHYYFRYCFCCRSIDFESVDTIVELGMGAGKQAELLAKIYPRITFYLLDLPPQAYLTGQFLRAIFGNRVKDYRTFRKKESICGEEGSINILCNWQIEALAPKGRVLFWNAASFQEMEPHVVDNYLSIASEWSEQFYLHQCMGGKESGERGKGGVLTPTVFDDYNTILSKRHQFLIREPAYGPLKRLSDSGGYEDALWTARDSGLEIS